MSKPRRPKSFPKAQVSAGIRRAVETADAEEFDLACYLPVALTILAGLAGIKKHYGTVYRGLELDRMYAYAMEFVEPCLATSCYRGFKALYLNSIAEGDPARLWLLSSSCMCLHPVVAYLPMSAWSFPKELLNVLVSVCRQRVMPELNEVQQAVYELQISACVEPDPQNEPNIVSSARSIWMLRQYWDEIRNTALYLSDCRVNLTPNPFTNFLVSIERRIKCASCRIPITHPLVARISDMRQLVSMMLTGDDALARKWRDWTCPLIQEIQVDVERASMPLLSAQHVLTEPERLFFNLFQTAREQAKVLERHIYADIRSGKIKGVPWEAEIDRKLAELRQREQALNAVNIATCPAPKATESGTRSPEYPVVNMAEFTVSMGRRACCLGNSLPLRIAARLVAAKGHFVPHQELVESAWGRGADTRSQSAVRTAICRLRKQLREAGMADVVIDGTQMGHYRLFVQESQV